MARLLFFATLSIAALPGCVAKSYMGIDLAPGAVAPAVQTLARQARAGDKHAQLKLGSYYQHAADGLVAVEQEASPDRARMEDAEYANEIFRIGMNSKDLKRYGSWKMLAMTRASELYKRASTDSGGERMQAIPASSPGGAITTSRTSTGPLQKGLPEAARLLGVIESAVFREQFVTSFNDPYGEVCQEGYTYADWLRDAHFIVEGRLSYSLVAESNHPETERPVRREGQHYEAEVEIDQFLKWPDKFPRPKNLTFDGRVVYGQLLDEHTGDYRGCETWGPENDSNKGNAIIVLQYQNSPIGAGRFEIVRTIKFDSGSQSSANVSLAKPR